MLAGPAGDALIWLLIEPRSGVLIVQDLPGEQDAAGLAETPAKPARAPADEPVIARRGGEAISPVAARSADEPAARRSR